MPRIIKFRAWHLGLKKMFTAEEMTVDQMALLPDGHFANIHSANTKMSRIYSHLEMLPLQFTGLHDKTGKEIWEGDIVRCNPEVEYYRVVTFIDGNYWLINPDRKCDIEIQVVISSHKETEVLGNIHENPELIEGK